MGQQDAAAAARRGGRAGSGGVGGEGKGRTKTKMPCWLPASLVIHAADLGGAEGKTEGAGPCHVGGRSTAPAAPSQSGGFQKEEGGGIG